MDRLKVSLVAIDRAEVPVWLRPRLEAHGVELVIQLCDSSEAVARASQNADVIWLFGGSTLITPETLRQTPRCGAILRTGTGTDNVPVEEATRLGIIVANTPEATTDAVAEHAIGLLFAAVRKIAVQDRAVRNSVWDPFYAWPNAHITGSTLGLVGFGRIARAVAARMHGFGMRILACDPLVDPGLISQHNAECVPLHDLLEQSDFVSIHCPLTEVTRGLIDVQNLARMKPTAVLINTARGALVDEFALAQALSENRLAGAGLDVFSELPLDQDHPLLKLDNVVLTPHIAGASDVNRSNFWEHSAETLVAMARDRRPIWIVNPEVKPRWTVPSVDSESADVALQLKRPQTTKGARYDD